MIKPTAFKAKLTARTQLTHDVVELDFQVTEGKLNYETGQFIMLIFESEGKTEQRAYSISSQSTLNQFQLCIKIIPGGKGSTLINNSKVGDTFDFKGPFGFFYVKPENQADLLMIGTGTGIAPIKGIADHLLSQNDNRNITILFGVRYPSDVFYQEHFSELTKKHPNLKVIITCSQPENDPEKQNWDSFTGRVTDYFTTELQKNTEQHIYICGNGHMVKDIRNRALDAGIDKKQIHLENFG